MFESFFSKILKKTRELWSSHLKVKVKETCLFQLRFQKNNNLEIFQ